MSHDYDPEWDYDLDPKPDAAVVNMVKQYLEAHQRDGVFSRLEFEKLPRVHYIKLDSLDNDKSHVARYINGTRNEPVIVIDAKALLAAAAQYDLELQNAVEPTLLHEYGHANLEIIDRHDEMDPEEEERRVEEFAHTYWSTRDLDDAARHLTEG